MGKVVSMMTRPIRNINVEKRVHKVISKDKPIPAPRYEATIKQLKIVEELDPEFMEKQNKKDAQLDSHLKKLYVTSQEAVPNESDPKRLLPTARVTDYNTDASLYMVKNVRQGRCSLQQLQTFLTEHMDNPKKHSAQNIADTYFLDVKVVENLLEHYKVFRIISEDDVQKMKEKSMKKLEESRS